MSSKIVEALEIGADAVRAELEQAKQAFKGHPLYSAYLEGELAKVESALAEARAAPPTPAASDRRPDYWVLEDSGNLHIRDTEPASWNTQEWNPVWRSPAPAAEPVAWQARFRGEDGWGPWWDCRERDLEVYNELPNWETRALGVIAPPPVEASPLPGVRVVSNPAIPPGEAYIVNGDEMHRVEASQQQPSGETTRPLSDLIQLAAEIIRTSEPDHEDYAWPATVPRYVIRDVLRSERAADQKRKDWGYKLRVVYDRLAAELSKVSGRSADMATKAADEIDRLAAERDAAKAEAEAMRKAIQAAIDCGMVPIGSARDGGASKHAVQYAVADMLRDAIAAQQGEKP